VAQLLFPRSYRKIVLLADSQGHAQGLAAALDPGTVGSIGLVSRLDDPDRTSITSP
jgi:hypothetical protein